MSRVQNKKICIDLTLSSDDEDEMIDNVIKPRRELPTLPREIWLKIWSFEFGEDAEQYTDVDRNLSKRKEYGKSIKYIQNSPIQNSIEMEKIEIKETKQKIKSFQLEIIELDTVYTPENYRIFQILSAESAKPVNWKRRKTTQINKLKKKIADVEECLDMMRSIQKKRTEEIIALRLKIINLSNLCRFVK